VAKLNVEEAAGAYIRSMRNVLPPGEGVCATCGTFISGDFTRCYPCGHQAANLDAVVPITYSEHGGQMHKALWGYKNGHQIEQDYAGPRVAAILWLFLVRHEACVARAAGAAGQEFDVITTVPSSTKARDKRNRLRTIVGWVRPLKPRLKVLLEPTDQVPEGRTYDQSRYVATERLDGQDVLLIDDTWTAGGHAQSAAHALKAAGARTVALVVVGRHIQRGWQVGDATHGELFDALPKQFDWEVCRVHAA
jgi:predicted amidophosphoribosyltransferase